MEQTMTISNNRIAYMYDECEDVLFEKVRKNIIKNLDKNLDNPKASNYKVGKLLAMRWHVVQQ
jgi:glutamate/tyrosine decarboxylase-like PLP-dependent enzyme